MTDALVTSAIHHWAPRLVANGVSLTDFEEVTASLGSWNDWCAGWSARAATHEQMGREALAHGKHLSAGEHLQRAGVYYHFAKFLFVHDLTPMKAAHMKAVECRTLALPYLVPAGERCGSAACRHATAFMCPSRICGMSCTNRKAAK